MSVVVSVRPGGYLGCYWPGPSGEPRLGGILESQARGQWIRGFDVGSAHVCGGGVGPVDPDHVRWTRCQICRGNVARSAGLGFAVVSPSARGGSGEGCDEVCCASRTKASHSMGGY